MKIAICDDNAAYRQQIYQCIQDAGVLNSDDKIIQYNNNFTALGIFNFYLFHGLFDDVSVGSQFLHSTLSDIF